MRDKLIRNVCGVGYMGYGKYSSSIKKGYKRMYDLWGIMIWRCYSDKIKTARPSYDECLVCDRWHNYQLFCEDIQEIEGYNLWLDPKNKMQLDKDTKIKGNKIYSKETCRFVSPKENMSVVRNGKYLATKMATGYRERFASISSFSRKYNLSRSTVSLCLKGTYRQTGGWSFEALE